MKQRQLVIIKGISGSGKSAFAELIAEPKSICCADSFFEDEHGNYNWDVSKLGQAHAHCQTQFDNALIDDTIDNIVIANTNTKPSDYQYYVNKATQEGLRITYVVLEKRHDNKNIHGLPDFVLERQYDNLINNLKLK